MLTKASRVNTEGFPQPVSMLTLLASYPSWGSSRLRGLLLIRILSPPPGRASRFQRHPPSASSPMAPGTHCIDPFRNRLLWETHTSACHCPQKRRSSQLEEKRRDGWWEIQWRSSFLHLLLWSAPTMSLSLPPSWVGWWYEDSECDLQHRVWGRARGDRRIVSHD